MILSACLAASAAAGCSISDTATTASAVSSCIAAEPFPSALAPLVRARRIAEGLPCTRPWPRRDPDLTGGATRTSFHNVVEGRMPSSSPIPTMKGMFPQCSPSGNVSS